jgi:hypothetical protein
MKIAVYGEKLTLEQNWEGAISTAVHAVCIRGPAHFWCYEYVRAFHKAENLLYVPSSLQ